MGSRDRSVARQIFVLQVLAVLLIVATAVVLAYVDARRDQLGSARERSLAIAETVAGSPTVLAALGQPDPSRTLQPFAEQVRTGTGTNFVVVMALDRTRFSDPVPARVGQRFDGELGGAPDGGSFTQEYVGPLGPSMRAVVPVRDGDTVVALVSVGITLDRIGQQLGGRLLPIVAAGVAVLVLGATGAWLISRRLRRQTHGLGAGGVTRMYELYAAVLHAVRDGLLLLDEAGRVQLVNDEARRLLDLGPDVVGRPVDVLPLPHALTRSMRDGTSDDDEIHLVGARALLVNQAAARWQGREVGSVVTLRDLAGLRAVPGEPSTLRTSSETLHAAGHDAAYRLHTVVSLVELGKVDEAVELAATE